MDVARDVARDVEFAVAGAVKGSGMVETFTGRRHRMEWYRVVPIAICYGTDKYQRKSYLG